MRVALVHDWLVSMRGGERVLEAFCELFPDADLFTLVHQPGACSETIERMRIRTSFIDRLPMARERYRHMLPLFPFAIEAFDFNGYDLVLSSSHCVAKGVITPPGAVHVSYVHTPMRYLWDQYGEYFGPGRAGALTRLGARAFATPLRVWDEASANRVDVYVSNSHHVAARVQKRYRRASEVVHPPVDVERFRVLPPGEVEDFYLMVSALVPYKRVDVAIEAFRRTGRRLRIVGAGPEEKRLKALAGGAVEFLGRRSDEEVAELFSRCRALVFPGEEDAGITPLEAQASGRPVLALGRGGALETVVGLSDGAGTRAPTGVFFPEPTVGALSGAIERLEKNLPLFDPIVARQNAQRFDRANFKRRMRELIDRAITLRGTGRGHDSSVMDLVH